MNYISVVKENFLNTPIDYLKGIGPNRSEILKKEFQIFTFKDLLYFFPFRYIDRTNFYKIKEIEKSSSDVQIIGKFLELRFHNKPKEDNTVEFNIKYKSKIVRLSEDEVMSCENDVTVYVNYLTEIKNYLNSLNTDDELFVGLV